jgi:hypothetical protein
MVWSNGKRRPVECGGGRNHGNYEDSGTALQNDAVVACGFQCESRSRNVPSNTETAQAAFLFGR